MLRFDWKTASSVFAGGLGKAKGSTAGERFDVASHVSHQHVDGGELEMPGQGKANYMVDFLPCAVRAPLNGICRHKLGDVILSITDVVRM